jgi:hypothetical protein
LVLILQAPRRPLTIVKGRTQRKHTPVAINIFLVDLNLGRKDLGCSMELEDARPHMVALDVPKVIPPSPSRELVLNPITVGHVVEGVRAVTHELENGISDLIPRYASKVCKG